VFFAEEVLVDSPVERTLGRISSWLAVGEGEAAAAAAMAAGGRVLARAGFAGLGKTVEVRTLRPHFRDGVIVVPLRWAATGRLGNLFPTLDANLEISACVGGRSRVALIGSYRPPMGSLGASLDRAVLSRAGRVTIRRWLRGARAAVTAAEDPVVATRSLNGRPKGSPESVRTSTDRRPGIGGLPAPG
jgi:hypothetical protein